MKPGMHIAYDVIRLSIFNTGISGCNDLVIAVKIIPDLFS